MSTITVTFIQADGVERVLENAEVCKSLMEAGRDNGVLGILADCGGCCDCGTCHVHVDEAWRELVGPPNDVEVDTMNLVENLQEGVSRLSCQIELRQDLDGLRVTVATSG